MSDSNVQNCPEPIPYSNEIYGFGEVDFAPTSKAVFDNSVKLISVDNILSNQLGDITPPVQSFSGNPTLAPVGDNDAKPLLSSYVGADITLPTTLASVDTNSVPNNNIAPQPEIKIEPSISSMPIPSVSVPLAANENFKPKIQERKFEHFGPNIPEKNNLANFINQNNFIKNLANRNSKPKNIETFSASNKQITNSPSINKNVNMKTMDMLVFGIVLCVGAYYYVSTYHAEWLANIDVNKIPIVSQLNDPNVTKENKIIIIIAIVIGIVLVSRMLK